MKNYKDLVMEETQVELTEGVEKLLKHPMMKGLKKPKNVVIDDDLSGMMIPKMWWGRF